MKIKEIQDQIVEEFDIFDSWMDKYEYLIELGKSVPVIDDINKTDDNIIKVCQSKVWLHSSFDGKKIHFQADSDAIISKGIVAILLSILNNRSPNEILSADLSFIDDIGLKEHLSPNRANGLSSMLKQIKFYALAYSKLN